MSNTWLLFDSPYLVWRAYHSTGHLSFKTIPTGITFGYLKAMIDLQSLFLTNKIAHCFDRGKSLRKQIYPNYKIKRKTSNEDETQKQLRFAVKNQINLLRKEYLPEIGCKNVFGHIGYEADDVIASICKNLNSNDKAIIVSSDKDLFQLLSDNVSFYNPQRKITITKKSFEKEWGLQPNEWSKVKAIAGCSTDDIIGVKGVKEKTAAKFLIGKLKSNCISYKRILESEELQKINLPLVSLPFEGINTFDLLEDKLDRQGWEKLTNRMGIKSLMNLRRLLPFNSNINE